MLVKMPGAGEAPVHAVQTIGRQARAARMQAIPHPRRLDVMNRLGGEADQDEERDAEGDPFVV
jgi:hypothetical protein